MIDPVEVHDSHVRIADMTVAESRIAERLFVNCVIEGPAILLPMGAGQLRECTFDLEGYPPEAMLYELPSRPCLGTVALVAVGFERCTFRRIGWAGTAETLAPFRAMMP